MNTNRLIALAVAIACLLALPGCAKFPETAPTLGKQLVLTLKVRGRISPIDETDPSIQRHYFIAIDNDGSQYTGPWAVAYPPYGGNGWVTSRDADKSIGLTSFIQYDSSNPNGYIYSILPGSFFLNTSSPQTPIRYELLEGGTTLRFTIDFSQIATTAIPGGSINQLDINFITTNELAVNPDDLYTNREWDGLGPSGQDYVNVDTTTDRLYAGEDADAHDVTDPDLDIVYWSVQVQTVSSR